MIGHWICPLGNNIPVVAVASHDTASAVIASPLANKDAAYLSSGTWSLMGFESTTPYTSEYALAANITNEGGAEGRYRVLKNIMGLWLLQRVIKEQNITDLPALIAETEQLSACRFLINPNEDRFINPDNMSAEIQAACRETSQPCRSALPSWRAVFSTALPYFTPTFCTNWSTCAANRSANCMSSAAVARTTYSTSYVPTPAA